MSTPTNFARPEQPKSMHDELRDLAASLSEIVKGIRVAQEPILESQRKVPQATEQLEKITRQTEDATHRVLDMAEHITSRESEIESLLKDLRRSLPATYFRNNSKAKALIERIRECAHQNQAAAYDIMDALQFQDITSQQIDHAITLLEQVQNRLQEVLMELAGEEHPAAPGEKRKERAYDPNAHFSTGDNNDKQSSVDELVDSLSRGLKKE
jgi:chemotaxis regulatin CheY-phosphate phosphatase CheZ